MRYNLSIGFQLYLRACGALQILYIKRHSVQIAYNAEYLMQYEAYPAISTYLCLDHWDKKSSGREIYYYISCVVLLLHHRYSACRT